MVRHHVAYAVRSLCKRPGFTVVAVATLALGIGANTAIFTVVNTVLLRPLPYPDAGQRVRVRGSSIGTRQPGNLSPMDFLDLSARARSLDAFAAYNNYAGATLTGVGEPERLVGTRVTASFFTVLGVPPRLGRDFRPDDDQPGASPVAVLADGFWRRRFGADPEAIGRTIFLNSVGTTVIGVLPPGFAHPFPDDARQPDVFVPFKIDRAEHNRGGHYLQAIARLNSGTALAAARSDLAGVASELAREYPDTDIGRTVTLEPVLESMVGSARPALLVLLGTVTFVLLIACANLANLMLARSESRQKEIALRQAIGASRAQLVLQLLTESMVLAAAGGAAGLALAAAAARVVAVLGADRIPRGDTIHLDFNVLLFTAAVSLATGLLFGVGPALYATRSAAAAGLRDGGRHGEGRLRRRTQQALIISEVALALMLLVGAGLLAKSFWRLQSVDPGFHTDRVLTLQTSLPLARYAEGEEIPFYQRLMERLRPLPGVSRVAAVNILPLDGNYSCDGFDVEGRPSPRGQQPCAEARSITPDYFAAMGIPLVRGRTFTDEDTERSRPVVVIDEKMARTFWPNRDPLGARILRMVTDPSTGKPTLTAREIVGIVGGVKHFGLDRDVTPEMYTPHAQQPSYHTMTLVIRASGDPMTLVPMIRRVLGALDYDVPMSNIRTMERVVSDSTTQPRFRMLLVSAFAGLALALSLVGVAGVLAYVVRRRTHEIGVRVALGATRSQVVSLLMRQGMAPALIGLAIGLAGALAVTRTLRGLLFGVTATDAGVFAAAAALLGCAAAVATYVPARRATVIDPTIALRTE